MNRHWHFLYLPLAVNMIMLKSNAAFSNVTNQINMICLVVQQVANMEERMEDEREINVSCYLAGTYVEFNNQAITTEKHGPVSWASGVASSFRWIVPLEAPLFSGCVVYVLCRDATVIWIFFFLIIANLYLNVPLYLNAVADGALPICEDVWC